MRPEDRAWDYLRKKMRGRWHAQRHEDRLTSGIPDVSWAARGVDGWIELKALEAWPARVDTPIDVGLSAEQAEWLTARGREGGGRVFVLLRVDRNYWLLFKWTVARDLSRNRYDADQLFARTVRYWTEGLDPETFLEEIVG